MEPSLDSKPDLILSVVRTASDATPPPRIMRTPSPTPSEVIALKQKGAFNVRASLARSSRKQKICIYLTLVIILTITILLAVFHDKLVNKLAPTANTIKGWKGGWLIPVAILIVFSFPPFIGHELIIIVVGVVWGLGIGFAIAAGGTLCGEIANYFVFNSLCRARSGRYERKRIDYACLARVLRDGGLKVAIITRYSFIPQHFSTTVFSTCGVKFWVFVVSAIVSLPRHLVTVYIGVALNDDGGHVTKTKKEKIITWVALSAIIVISGLALRYINKLSDNVKEDVIYRRRKDRQTKGEYILEPFNVNGSASNGVGEPIALMHVVPRLPAENHLQQGLEEV